MQPPDNRDCVGCRSFGEVNADSNLHGRGIQIYPSGEIYIGYFNNYHCAPGRYINIWSNGEFRVGEVYFKDGEMRARGTEYKNDGTSDKYDYGY